MISLEDSNVGYPFRSSSHSFVLTASKNYDGKDTKKESRDKTGVQKASNNAIHKDVAMATCTYSESPSSPLTPIPMGSYTNSDNLQLTPISSPLEVDNQPSQMPLSISGSNANSMQVQENPGNPRAKPKPSPIATKLPRRTTSLSSIDDTIDRNLGRVDCNTLDMFGSRKPFLSTSPTSAESVEVGGRDSGVALETWDTPHTHLDMARNDLQRKPQDAPKREQFPSFDQLFQPQLELLDPFRVRDERADSIKRAERRQRCRSMMCPTTARVAGIEDPFSKSDAEPLLPSNSAAVDPTTSAGSKVVNRTRTKRVSSMSIGNDSTDFKDFPLNSHDLPPLPPKVTSAATVPRTSFFTTPSLQENTTDTNQSRSLRWTSNSSSSSLSSSSSSATSATISLPGAVSPPLTSVLAQPHGIPFSNMLDLATAKAENITGLYFAKQMNRKSASSYTLKNPLASTQGTHTSNFKFPKDNADIPPSSSEHRGQSDAVPVKVEIDTPSPILGYIPCLSDPERVALSSQCIPEISKQPCIKTSIETQTSHILNQDTSINSNVKAVYTQASSSTPARGHRRSQSASHFFHLSSLKHHSPAQFNLALCYEHGQGGVDKDLEKAIYFYQQAAGQGHTKASYNIGCICYNQGEVSKAMAWFESAGKCCIRGLRTETSEQSAPANSGQQQSLQFPLPKQTTLPHELEDILLGDRSSDTGPFAAYLPAILCLALLCRQGVQTRGGNVILKKDDEQSVELLQVLLQRASSRSHLRKDKDQLEPKQCPLQGSRRDRSLVGRKGTGNKTMNRSKSGSQNGVNQLGSLSTETPIEASSDRSYCSSSQPRERIKRSSRVEDETDDDRDAASDYSHEIESSRPSGSSTDAQGSDDHETWSLTLTEQLLKVWKRTNATAPASATSISADSTEVEKRQKRILRHHLLYITNPTLGKNLYNLGVLYDLYLGNAAIAVKCYRSAYHQELPIGSSQEQPGFVTRINSAWNLGVLHVRRKEWNLAKEWFLRAQRDIRLHEGHQRPKENSHDLAREECTRIRAAARRSLVNVVPHSTAPLVSDSPGKEHARQHGLMMHLGAISSKPTKVAPIPDEPPISKEGDIEPRKVKAGDEATEDGIRTDSGKIAWVLRWVESHIE
ncbi:hypothetical protein BGZ80_009490 [Entomortierella chlamydospora]|uniref:Chitin synthase activator n=1 Tax=Entomortierella chlamydospora TaxID=101097 RepID=A0A9P6MXI3_9FUNG|nr:hypothetical protein BGZ80_009490 [Entomortierella chlamydospora]